MDGLVAFPSEQQGGLEAPVSEHFGQCSAFTLVQVHGGKPGHVDVVPATAHEERGCLGVVRMLADRGVQAVVAVGMGRRPLEGLLQAGIDVYQGDPARSIPATIEALESGQLPRFGAVCAHQSHHGRHGHQDGECGCE